MISPNFFDLGAISLVQTGICIDGLARGRVREIRDSATSQNISEIGQSSKSHKRFGAKYLC